MLRTLSRVGRALNDAGVRWGVGASRMLQQYTLLSDPRDMDILVPLEDAEMAATVLHGLGEPLPVGHSALFATKFFRRFRVGETDVDLLAGFRINHASGRYEYVFDEASIAERREIEGVLVPFAALEDWYVLYQLMPDKASKADLIEAHLIENGVRSRTLLERALRGDLPSAVRARIEETLKTTDKNRPVF